MFAAAVAAAMALPARAKPSSGATATLVEYELEMTAAAEAALKKSGDKYPKHPDAQMYFLPPSERNEDYLASIPVDRYYAAPKELAIVVDDAKYSVRAPASPDGKYAVLKTGSEILSFESHAVSGAPAVKAFYAHGRDWILEPYGDAIVSGQSVKAHPAGSKKPYDEVFFYRFYLERPFYFFRDGSKFGFSYSDGEMTIRYDEIVHDQWPEADALNPAGFQNAVKFYARKGKKWLFVKVRFSE